MITRNDYGEVAQLIFSIGQPGQVGYTGAFYWTDGVLIDTGPLSLRSELTPFLDALEVDVVVNTHHHEDHIGNNPVLEERGVPILAHPIGVPLINDTSLYIPKMLYYQRFLFDLPPSSRCQPVDDHIDGRKYQFRVIHTPGHSADHIVLLEEENGWLFSGDLFRSVKVTHFMRDEDFEATMNSLERLMKYDFDTIFCAGGGIYEQGKEKLKEKIEWWKTLQEEASRMAAEGVDYEIIRDQLLGKENSMAQFTEGDYTKLNMIEAVVKSKRK